MASVESGRKNAEQSWSGQSSGIGPGKARPDALRLARELLQDSEGDSDDELLRRLEAVGDDGMLTNAASLLLVGNGRPVLEYRLKGGHQELRPDGELSVLEQLSLVLDAVRRNNPEVQMPEWADQETAPALSESAAREAVVNGVAHRDWRGPRLVEVEQEHRFGALRVRSPGGFIGGFDEYDVFSRQPFPRNRALMRLLAGLGLAENRGSGIGRMVTGLVRGGQPAPTFREVEGASVEVTLGGGRPPDPAWQLWLAKIKGPQELTDHRVLLLLRWVADHRWVDVRTASRIAHTTEAEARSLLRTLEYSRVLGARLLVPIAGVPSKASRALTFSATARDSLAELYDWAKLAMPGRDREAVARSYVQARGRLSTTELGSIIGLSSAGTAPLIRKLERVGVMRPAWANRKGRGFHYVLTEPSREKSA